CTCRRDVVLPRLDDFDTSIFLEDRRAVLGPFAVGVNLLFRYRNHESCDVHASAPSIDATTPNTAYRRRARLPSAGDAIGIAGCAPDQPLPPPGGKLHRRKRIAAF